MEVILEGYPSFAVGLIPEHSDMVKKASDLVRPDTR
jgi:hypothetical protein